MDFLFVGVCVSGVSSVGVSEVSEVSEVSGVSEVSEVSEVSSVGGVGLCRCALTTLTLDADRHCQDRLTLVSECRARVSD